MAESEIIRLKDRLADSKYKFILIPHISPDGDAAGSCSALCEVLLNDGHEAVIMTCDHFPEYLKFLTHISESISLKDDKERCISLLKEADFICMLDHNAPSREGDLQPLVAQYFEGETIMIDHHLEPQPVDYTISHVHISSTCELLYGVICGIWGREVINSNVATSLYTGINTDTGGLSHNSSTSAIYRVIGELLDLGLDKELVHDHIYRMNHLSRLRLIGNALLNKLNVNADYPVALIPISKDELDSFGYKEGDLEGLVNMPLGVKEVEVSVQIVQRSERIKLSFRSKGTLPVNEWTKAYFSGGGHRNAAGGQWHGTLQEAVDKVNETTAWFFKTYGNK
ncbi:MAG: DHH family phosphoesterase [Marinifilaceae bacterium]